MTKQELIDKVREVAARLGRKTLLFKDFQRETGIGDYRVKRHFDNWSALCEAAGIESERNFRLDDETILRAMRDALMALGTIGTSQQFARHFRYGPDVWRSRWRDWLGALTALRDWALVNDPNFPHMEALERRIAHGRGSWSVRKARAAAVARLKAEAVLGTLPEPLAHPLPEPLPGTSADRPADPPSPPEAPAEPLPQAAAEPPPQAHRAGPLVGEMIAYRSVMFAPTNEMGVVMLFAVAAEALGFVIESAGTTFPDCYAWQRVAPGRYRRVRIEFEYASTNFRIHRHDPKGCELLVCWEHDWFDCPVKVLDVKKEIARLKKG
jgi:hypothetical protein